MTDLDTPWPQNTLCTRQRKNFGSMPQKKENLAAKIKKAMHGVRGLLNIPSKRMLQFQTEGNLSLFILNFGNQCRNILQIGYMIPKQISIKETTVIMEGVSNLIKITTTN